MMFETFAKYFDFLDFRLLIPRTRFQDSIFLENLSFGPSERLTVDGREKWPKSTKLSVFRGSPVEVQITRGSSLEAETLAAN